MGKMGPMSRLGPRGAAAGRALEAFPRAAAPFVTGAASGAGDAVPVDWRAWSTLTGLPTFWPDQFWRSRPRMMISLEVSQLFPSLRSLCDVRCETYLRFWTVLITKLVSLMTVFFSSSSFSTRWFSCVASIDWIKYSPSERMTLLVSSREGARKLTDTGPSPGHPTRAS